VCLHVAARIITGDIATFCYLMFATRVRTKFGMAGQNYGLYRILEGLSERKEERKDHTCIRLEVMKWKSDREGVDSFKYLKRGRVESGSKRHRLTSRR